MKLIVKVCWEISQLLLTLFCSIYKQTKKSLERERGSPDGFSSQFVGLNKTSGRTLICHSQCKVNRLLWTEEIKSFHVPYSLLTLKT